MKYKSGDWTVQVIVLEMTPDKPAGRDFGPSVKGDGERYRITYRGTHMGETLSVLDIRQMMGDEVFCELEPA